MTRHDTTRHDTTRHDTHACALKAAVIGSVEGVTHTVKSIQESTGYICTAAVIEGYIAKNFWHNLSSLGKSEKLKAIFKGMKAFRSFRKILSKVPEKYFSSTYVRKNPFNIIPDKIFSDADVILVARDDDDYRRRDEIKTSDYVADLMRRGISRDKIFVVPREMFSAEIPVVEDGKLSPLCRNVNDTKPVLRYMEYHVTDFCNLKCRPHGELREGA